VRCPDSLDRPLRRRRHHGLAPATSRSGPTNLNDGPARVWAMGPPAHGAEPPRAGPDNETEPT